jgi:hypothetical protein
MLASRRTAGALTPKSGRDAPRTGDPTPCPALTMPAKTYLQKMPGTPEAGRVLAQPSQPL